MKGCEEVKKVCIDPGHGGKDKGSTGVSGYIEANGVLDISIKLKDKLLTLGFDVVMTREKDETVSLVRRANIINTCGADIAVSIHTNASKNSSAHGIETYYSAFSKLSDMLAKFIQDEVIKETGLYNRGIKKKLNKDGKDFYFIIRNSQIPIVLIECGFATNEIEGKLLSSSIFREKIAQGILNGIIKYFNNVK